MSGSTISTAINHGIVLDTGTYASPLTITSAGSVYQSGASTPAIYGTLATDAVINDGTVTGGSAGIELANGGSVGNSGSISGANGIYIKETVSTPAFISNSFTGVVSGGGNGSGVYIRASASLTNFGTVENAGTLSGAVAGIYAYGLGGTIINTGLIESTGFGTPVLGNGIFVTGSAEVINGSNLDTEALIIGIGGGDGVNMATSGKPIPSIGTVINYGSIFGGTHAGVQLGAGTVVNGSSLDTTAQINGVTIGGSNGLLENYGTIASAGLAVNLIGGSIINGSATDTGVLISAGTAANGFSLFDGVAVNYGSIVGGTINTAYLGEGSFTNLASGIIEGPDIAFRLGGPGVLNNAGTILAKIGVATGPYGSNTIINDGFIGSTLGNAGTAVSFGRNNDLLVDDPGAVFVGTVAGGSGANTLELAVGAGTITGLGTQFVQFETIAFDSGADWLAEGNSLGLASAQVIDGFSYGDTIDLDGFTFATDSYVSGAGLILTNGTSSETLGITGSYATGDFLVSTIATGTEVELLCYLRGTWIATPAGEAAVESLGIGDTVITRFGGYQKIKWIGRQSYARRFVQGNREQLPVKIAAGALGPELPRRDLFISPGHSMLIDGVLVLAKALVNGVTITQDEAPEEIHYHQLEFETHDCVLAEGAWSESFADTPDIRNKFHNVAEFWALYPDYETPQVQRLCAPRPQQGAMLEAVLRPVVARAAAGTAPGPLQGWIDHAEDAAVEGWAQDAMNPELPVLLEVLVHDEVVGTVLACGYRDDLAKAGIGLGWCHFTLALPAKLSAEARRTIRVRRAPDGAEVPMSAPCKAALGIKGGNAPRRRLRRAG